MGPVKLYSRCASCGGRLPAGKDLCPHHAQGFDGWAEGNRAVNDLVHRRKVQPRAPMTSEELAEFVDRGRAGGAR